MRAGLVASTGEARRQIRGGGLKVNDGTVTDERAVIGRDALGAAGVVKLSLGRKKHVLLLGAVSARGARRDGEPGLFSPTRPAPAPARPP